MISLRFFLGKTGESVYLTAPDGSDKECLALPPQADRAAFWRQKTGDQRIQGHVLVWEVAEWIPTITIPSKTSGIQSRKPTALSEREKQMADPGGFLE